MSQSESKERSPIKAGWISLVLGLVFCFLWGMGGIISIGLPGPLTIISVMLALPLLLAAFILSIVGMCKGYAFGGIALMVGTVVFPAMAFFVGWIASTFTAT